MFKKILLFCLILITVGIPSILSLLFAITKLYYEYKEGCDVVGPTAIFYPDSIFDVYVHLSSARLILLSLSGLGFFLFLYLILFVKAK
jgi:hypothetical protein